jgi:hypothetical protein
MSMGTAGRARKGARVVVVIALALALTGNGAVRRAMAGDEESAFGELRTHRLWSAWSDARPVSPYLGGDFADLIFGVPYSHSYLEGNPGRSGALASYAYGSESGEALLEIMVRGYENPTLAISRYPNFGRHNREEVAPAGENGPRSTAHAPTRTDAEAEVRLGPGNDTVGLQGGFARAVSHYNRDDLLVEETESAVKNAVLPGGVTIRSVHSMIRIETRVGREPLITYRFSLADVAVGGDLVVGAGHDGIVLAGRQVPAGDLASQFDHQLVEDSAAVQALAALSLAVLAPRVEHQGAGGYLVTGVVLDAGRNNEAVYDDLKIRNRPGGVVGLRLGYARAYSQLVSFDH